MDKSAKEYKKAGNIKKTAKEYFEVIHSVDGYIHECFLVMVDPGKSKNLFRFLKRVMEKMGKTSIT